MVLDLSIKMPGANYWAEGKRQDFQVPGGGGKEMQRRKIVFPPCFRGKKGDQPWEISDGVVLGCLLPQVGGEKRN